MVAKNKNIENVKNSSSVKSKSINFFESKPLLSVIGLVLFGLILGIFLSIFVFGVDFNSNNSDLVKSKIDNYFSTNKSIIFDSNQIDLNVIKVDSLGNGLFLVDFVITDGKNIQEGQFYSTSKTAILVQSVFELDKKLE